MSLVPPPVWSSDELDRDRSIAIESFRNSRLGESVERSAVAHDDYRRRFELVLDRTNNLLNLDSQAAALLGDKDLLEAVRYLAGPPISADDLKVLSDVDSIAPSRIGREPEIAGRITSTIRRGIDRRRFPWLDEGRSPTDAERLAAIVSSAALASSQRVATDRRTESKTDQEELVRQSLRAARFEHVPTRAVHSVSVAPTSGQFCDECLVGSRQADILVTSYDHRMVPIECKVSNSSTNSIKRLNNDAAVKAEVWRKDFGERHVVPTAVLSGVYNLRNLQEAQHRGLTLFWAHNLAPLIEWLDQTKPPAS